jgi:hypothetical protein
MVSLEKRNCLMLFCEKRKMGRRIFDAPFFSPQSLGLNIEELFEDASDASRNYPNGTIFLKML